MVKTKMVRTVKKVPKLRTRIRILYFCKIINEQFFMTPT